MATSDQFLLPGYYNITSATITTFDGITKDISTLIYKLIIEESMNADSIRGYLSIGDGVGLLETLPLRGEERLFIEIEDILKIKRKYELFIYKVENVVSKETNDLLLYDMHFTSYMRWTAGKRRIIRPYEGLISNIAKLIFEEYYAPITKQIDIQETQDDFKCIIPNYTPIQAMKFLASRAYANFSPSCSFRFFETSESFFFASDEHLVTNAILADEIKEFTYIPYANPMSLSTGNSKLPMDLEAQLRNLIELRNTDRINTVKDLYSGAYKNNPIVIDFVNKTVTNNRYSYQDSKANFISLNATNREIEDVHSDAFIADTFTDENERRFLIFKDYQSQGDLPTTIRSEQHLPEIVSRRLTYQHMLYRNTIYAKAHGRLDLKAGDVIKLVIPEMTPNGTKNSKLSGNYLVHDCTHSFNQEVYEVDMMLTKFDWRED